MSWFPFAFSALTSMLLAVLLYAMPSITRPTLPLGVSVPQSHAQDPVIRQSVRRYRVTVLVALVVCLAMAGVLGTAAPSTGVIAPVLLMVALGLGGYTVTRSKITRAKRDGKWYDDVPVRLTANVAADGPDGAVQSGWFVAALALLAITAGIGVAIYPGLPSPMPIHWGADGVANGYADKSVGSAFAVVFIGFGIVALLFGASLLARFSPMRQRASDPPEAAAHLAGVQRHLIGGLLGQMAVVVALEMGVIAVASWSAPTRGWAFVLPEVGMVVLMAAVIAVYFVRYRRAVTAQPAGVAAGMASTAGSTAAAAPSTAARSSTTAGVAGYPPRPDAPDDDRYWKGGLVYFNRSDPALLVPKRFGIGWTINLGNPVGIGIGALILLLIAGGIVLGIVAPGSRS